MESQSLTTIEPTRALTKKITSSNPPFIQKPGRGNLLLTQSPPSRPLFNAFANIETTAWWWPSSKITKNIPLCTDILLNTTPVLQNIFKSRNNHENFTSGELFDCNRVKLRPSPSGNVSKAGQPIKDNPWHKRAQLRDTCLSTVRGTDASTRYVILVIFCAQYLTYTYKDRNEYRKAYTITKCLTLGMIHRRRSNLPRSQICDNLHWGPAPSISASGGVEVSWILWWKETQR